MFGKKRKDFKWAVCPRCAGEVYESQITITRYADRKFQNRDRGIVYCLDCEYVEDRFTFELFHQDMRSDLQRRVLVRVDTVRDDLAVPV